MEIIRGVERKLGLNLSICQDLSRPKIRTYDIGCGTLEIARGDAILLGVLGQ